MTKNQIAYWQLQETKRHQYHQDVELTRSNTELERSHRANEQYNLASLAEISRHNVATEDLTARQLSEVERHNRSDESIRSRTNDINESLGYANLNLGYANLAESRRTHIANESLTARGQNFSVLNTGISTLGNLASSAISAVGRMGKSGGGYTSAANFNSGALESVEEPHVTRYISGPQPRTTSISNRKISPDTLSRRLGFIE